MNDLFCFFEVVFVLCFVMFVECCVNMIICWCWLLMLLCVVVMFVFGLFVMWLKFDLGFNKMILM